MQSSGKESLVVRATACALAIGVNLLYLAVALLTPRDRTTPEESHPILIAITLQPRAAPVKPRPIARASASPSRPVPVPATDPAPTEHVSADPDSRIDWHAELSRSLGESMRQQEEQERLKTSLDSKPKALVMPEISRQPKAGDNFRLDGGAVLTWLSKRCYFLSDPGRLYGGSGRKCPGPSELDRRTAELVAGLEEVVKPDYLKEPPPLPKSPHMEGLSDSGN